MNGTHVLRFAALSLVLIVIPGPSVLFIVGRALAVGRQAILTTVVGNSAGEYAQVTAVALGLGLLLEGSVLAFTVVKLLGAAYLIVLGLRTLLHRRSAGIGLVDSQLPTGRATGLRQGFVVGASNPKTTVFFVAILPQFVERGGLSPILQMLLLGVVWTGIALVSDSAWGLAAVHAKGWLVRSPRRAEMASAASGVVMVGLGVGLAVTGSRN